MAWRKVKSDNDKKFTIQDMIKKIYCRELDYVKYDNLIYQGKILKTKVKYNVRKKLGDIKWLSIVMRILEN